MGYVIDVQELFRQAFGLNRRIYTVENTNTAQELPQYEVSGQLKTIPTGDTLKSSLGTAILNPVLFEAGSYKERLTNGQIITSDYPELLLPPTTLLEVNLKKVITKTALVAGQGTFKEYISLDDYTVRIRTIITGDSPEEVDDYLRQILLLWQVPKHIEVVSDYLDLFGIEALVIESVTPRKLEGRPLMLPLEIACISDKPLQLMFNGV